MKRRRKILWGAAALTTIALGTLAAVYVLVVIPRRVDRAIGVRKAAGTLRLLRVTREPVHRLDAPPPTGVQILTATAELRDGVSSGGTTYLATSGGLEVDEPHAEPRLLTWIDGLATSDVTAVARTGTAVAVGGADGSITVIDHGATVVVRFDTGTTRAAITDLAASGDSLYATTFGAGLLEWDGRQAAAISTGADPNLTALAVAEGRLAVGTASGHVFVRGDGRMIERPLDNQDDGAPVHKSDQPTQITALAWDGDALLVGTPFGLRRVAADGTVTRTRTDTFVTAIYVDGPGRRTYLGTFDDGVVILGATAEQHALARTRITRIRPIDDHVVAFGAGGAWDLATATPLARPTRPAIAGNHVTAIAERAGEMWVGTFENGIDILSAQDGHVLRHITAQGTYGIDQVNHILVRPDTRQTVISTVRGVLTIADDGSSVRSGPADGLIGDQVEAVASENGVTAFATNRGLTVEGADHTRRSLYALQGLANNHVYTVAWGVAHTLYVGTLGGISVVAPDLSVGKNIVSGPGALRAAWTTALVSAPEGVYAGTYGGGVVLLTADGKITDVSGLDKRAARLRVNPNAMLLDGDRLYVGTLEDGLYVYERGPRTWKPVELPLGSKNVTALAATVDALWVGTDRGLARIARNVADGS